MIKLRKVRRALSLSVALLMIGNGVVTICAAALLLLNIHEYTRYFADYYAFTNLDAVARANTVFSILIGFVMILLGIGLYRRKRSSWVISVIILLIISITNLYPIIKIHLFAFSSVSLLILLLSYKNYTVKGNALNFNQIVAWGAVFFALGYGVVGTYLLREQFHGIKTFIDALYYTIVTYSTVGYGDITPLTQNARLFTSTMIIIGLGAFATTISVLIAPLIEREIKGVFAVMNKLGKLNQHVIICGYNAITQQLIAELDKLKKKYILIERDVNQGKFAQELELNVLIGRPDSLMTLQKAYIDRAKTLICLEEEDAQNILIALTVNEHFSQAPKGIRRPFVIAKINQLENLGKAKRIGIDKVFSPAALSSLFVINAIDKKEKL